MTLKEIYAREKAKPRTETPAIVFVRELARLTKKSEVAVRRWLSDGESGTIPDALTQDVLAKHFNTTPEELFPQIAKSEKHIS